MEFNCKCGGYAKLTSTFQETSATCPKCNKLLALKLNVPESPRTWWSWIPFIGRKA